MPGVKLDFSKAQPIQAPTTPTQQPAGQQPVTLDFSKAQPVAGAQTSSQPDDHSILRDLTGSSADEWHQWNEQKKQEFLAHPVISAIKNLGSFGWGAVKAVDELSPASIQRAHSLYEDTKNNWEIYSAARKSGASIKDSLQAAQDASTKHNPLMIFRPPDEKSDITEHALYNSVAGTHGEGAAMVAVALKRTLRGFAEEFKKNPDEAAGNMSVKLLPVLLGKMGMAPEAGAAEGESAAGTAVGETKTLSNLEEPSVAKKVLNPQEASKTSGAIKGETAIREATGATDTSVPVRRSFGKMAEDLRGQAKPTYQKIDEVTGGKWQANKNALDDVETALRRESDIDKLEKLKARKTDLLNQKQQIQTEATQKGVAPEDIQSANAKWRQSAALEKLEAKFKPAVDAQDRVNLESTIKNLKNFDRLDDAMGGKANSAKLMSKLEDALKQQKSMQTKYTVAKVAGGTAAGLIGVKAFWGIVDSVLGGH